MKTTVIVRYWPNNCDFFAQSRTSKHSHYCIRASSLLKRFLESNTTPKKIHDWCSQEGITPLRYNIVRVNLTLNLFFYILDLRLTSISVLLCYNVLNQGNLSVKNFSQVWRTHRGAQTRVSLYICIFLPDFITSRLTHNVCSLMSHLKKCISILWPPPLHKARTHERKCIRLTSSRSWMRRTAWSLIVLPSLWLGASIDLTLHNS